MSSIQAASFTLRVAQRTGLVMVCGVAALAATAGDWPAWRFDAGRSGVSPEPLPDNLSLQWVAQFAPAHPAWPDPRLAFDAASQPVVAAGMLVLGSSSEDAIIAVDAATGAERWRYGTDAPVRMAPFLARSRVYAVSDDGRLLCLDLRTGSLIWKFEGAPGDQKVLGNERLISMWPARGGPVVHQGTVYFTAGIWPFMGVFVYAVDAETGRLRWHNDRASCAYGGGSDSASGASFGTVSPQGALAVAGDQLVVPSGRAWPAYFKLQTGEMAPHTPGIKDSSGGGESQLAVEGEFLLMGGCVFSVPQQRALVFNAPATTVKPFTALSILDGGTLYAAAVDGLEAHDLASATLTKLSGAYGRPLMRCDTRLLGRLPLRERVEVMIKASTRLFVAGAGWVAGIELPPTGAAPRVTWRTALEGTVGGLAAAGGRLFVSTREGRILCYGAGTVQPGAESAPMEERTVGKAPSAAAARAIVDRCGVREGFGYLVGIPDDDLVVELVRQTQLQWVVLEPDPPRVGRLRKRLRAEGFAGKRAAVVPEGQPVALPRYLASLIVSGRTLPNPADWLERLHPYGGVLCQTAGAEWKVARREGGLPGAGDWSHDAADAGNTWMSQDEWVKAPLGVLWFGGASGDPNLFMQRHSDPPSARFCQGRVFLHGDGQITAVDAYTGRVLWNRRLPAVRAFQNLRSNVEAGPPHEKTGETTKRTSFIAHSDGLYLAYGQTIQQWDAATGNTLAEYAVADESGAGSLFLGELRLAGEVLVAGADFFASDAEAAFVKDDFRDVPAGTRQAIGQHLREWAGKSAAAEPSAAGDLETLVQLANELLDDAELVKRVPRDARTQIAAASIERQLAVQRETHAPYLRIEHANRKLLEGLLPAIRKMPPKMHWSNLYPWDGAATSQLVGLDRRSGKLLWRYHAKDGIPQKSVAVGMNRVFCLDRVDSDVDDVLRRRGIANAHQPRLLALDLATGRVVWTVEEGVEGYETFYSAARDILVQASQHDPAPEQWWNKPRELSVRFRAFQGVDGRLLWDRKIPFNRPGGGHRLWHNWLLAGDTILLESYRDKDAEFFGYDLLTGADKLRRSPLTGVEQPWGFHRMGGCTKNVCCPNLVLFRSQSAGYYDLAGDGGTANLGGFRPGCKNSLIPAGGLLNAPNYASGCTCNYPVFTSLALIHMPQVEQWSTNDYPCDGHPVRRLGINLGAPGDRRAGDGTLWLDYPSVGGSSPDVPVTVEPAGIRWFYRHSSRLRGSVPGWIAGSGGEGIETFRIRLGKPEAEALPPHAYTVRLVFAEPNPCGPGARVFSVALQDREVLRDLDIAAQAGGPDIGLIREFRGVAVPSGELRVNLLPRVGKTILCGVAVIAED